MLKLLLDFIELTMIATILIITFAIFGVAMWSVHQ
jgi:hypothetical protein